MKNEIIVTEEQRSLIVEIFNSKLSEAEKDLLSACCVLCTYGVSKRDIQRVLDLEPSVLCAQVDTLLHEGVLVALGSDIIFAPQEVKRTVLAIHPVPVSMFNRIVENLYYRTFASMYTDGLQLKPFFDMAEGTQDYVVEYLIDDLDWELFGKLVANYAFQYNLYGRIEQGIHGKEELLSIRALQLVRTRIKGELYIKLTLLEALEWVNGFYYNNAHELLDEVDNVRKSTELGFSEPLYHFVKGLYFENYGSMIEAYSEFYKVYESSLNGDDLGFLRAYISMFIAYQCALAANDRTSALDWLQKVHWSVTPSHNIIRFYFHLTNAMLASGDLAETELTLAEKTVKEVNPDAQVLSRAYYCRYRHYANLGQVRRSSHFYLCYCHRLARFGSTEAAFVIYKAGEISRMVSENSLVTARRLMNELDRINLKSEDIAISVRLQCCQAYAECLAAIDMKPLSSTYCDIAHEIINASQPEQDAINAAANVFKGHFPSSLSETCFYFHAQKLKNDIEEVKKQAVQPGCLSREANVFKGIRKEISRLKGVFPEFCLELDIITAYILALTKPEKAITWWLKIVDKAKGEQKIRAALSAANYCSEIGYYWEEKKILESAMADNFAFHAANEGLRISLLIELANVTEIAGFRTAAAKMWKELITLTQGTELESKVLFLYAVNAYDYEDYSKAEMLIDRSIACYEQEESCVDETFASLLAYRSVILSGMGRCSEAKTAILDALRVYPDLRDKSSFTLYYDLAYYCIGNQEDSSAREALAKAKSLWGIGENEKAQIDELYDILRQPKEERGKYFQSSMDSEP